MLLTASTQSQACFGDSQVKDDPSFSGLSAKDVTKRVMPFVQFRMKEAQRAGKPVRSTCQTSALLARHCASRDTRYQHTISR